MSNIQSYNALIDRFKAFASGHYILKTFSHGQIDTADLEKFTQYPFMHVVPSNVTYNKGQKTFSFQIVLADLPRDKDDKVEFQREVLSDLQRIAEDLVAEITNHRVLFGDLITVQNVSLEPFLEEFHNTLTGWTVSLDLLVPYYWDACSIPAEWNDMFESGSGGPSSILTFVDSITRDEFGNVSLVNDEATPQPNYYYGTNDEGVRGWYLLSDEVGLTCETIGSCQTIIDIEAAIDLLQQDVIDLNADVALKADITSISAVGFSNDYNDLDNLPTIPPSITNTSELVNDGEDGVNPFITAQDLPNVSGFVPYTGATNDVNLGTHDLTATQGTFATNGNPDTLTVNHTSGSGKAITITKGGNGEGIYVNKTSGSGNAVTIVGDLEATNLKRTGGTSAQFLKANGSIDSTTYVPTSRTLTINGTTQDLSADRSYSIDKVSVGLGNVDNTSDLNKPVSTATQTALNLKQNTLVSGTNIKTINGATVLGSGDLLVGGSTSLAVGTTPITSGTVGRVLFQGTGNVLQQSANLFWDNTNGRLGIGTASPSSKLSVVDETLAEIQSSVFNNAAINAGSFLVRKSRGTIASPSAVLSGDRLGGFIFSGNNTGGGFYNGCALIGYANENFTPSAGGSYFAFETTSNGSVIRTERMRIQSNGNVLINTTTDAGFRLDVNGTARVSGLIRGDANAQLRGLYPFLELRPDGWAGGQTYIQAGLNFVGSNVGDYTLFQNPTGKGYAFYSGGVSAFFIHPTTRNFIINTNGDSGYRLFVNRGSSTNGAMAVVGGITDFAGSTATYATIQINPGVDPTSPVNGNIWFDGTNLKMRVGGLTKTFTLI